MPVAILVALSLTAIGGGSGIGGLGALSQIVSGPTAAGSGVGGGGGESAIGDAVSQLAAADAEVGAAPPTSAPTAPGEGPGSGPGDGGGPAPVGEVPTPGPNGGGPPGGGPPPGGGGGGGDDGGPDPPRPDPPGVVEGVGQDVKDVTGETPLAPTVEDAVDTLIEACGRVGCP